MCLVCKRKSTPFTRRDMSLHRSCQKIEKTCNGANLGLLSDNCRHRDTDHKNRYDSNEWKLFHYISCWLTWQEEFAKRPRPCAEKLDDELVIQNLMEGDVFRPLDIRWSDWSRQLCSVLTMVLISLKPWTSSDYYASIAFPTRGRGG